MTSRHGRRIPVGGTVSGMDFDADDPRGATGLDAVYGSDALVGFTFPTPHERAGS